MLHHQNEDKLYIPLLSVATEDSRRQFIASNSHLSEYGVLGFEYGYAQARPNTLTIWEAQFGDFANCAQVMIDTMISAGETKWNTKNGLVMLLPHGFDGQGPEHSSARLERFLDLCDEDEDFMPKDGEKQHQNVNWSVVNCSTSANFFHVLRRQLRRTFRKPLVVMSPKKLLRLKDACSEISEFDQGLRFHKAYDEKYASELVPKEKIRKVVLCSGQVYYDLINARKAEGNKDVAILRIEEFHPFPYPLLKVFLAQYKSATFHWCQEEHKNQGGWGYVRPRLNNLMKLMNKDQVTYYGRISDSTTATGYSKLHEK